MSNEDDEVDNISPYHGGNESTTLSVEVPQLDVEDDDSPQVNVEVEEEQQQQQQQRQKKNNESKNTTSPLQVDSKEEKKKEQERDQLGLNSPKGKQTSNPPLTTNNNNEGALTPNTLRYQMGVNSPRNKESSGWSAAAAEEDKTQNTTGIPANFITQVSKDDLQFAPKKQVTKQATTPPESNEEEKGSGFSSCFSCFMCCASSNTSKHLSNSIQSQDSGSVASNTATTTTNNDNNNNSNKQGSTAKSSSSLETSNTKLLAEYNEKKKKDDDNDNEEEASTESGTEYSAGLLKQQLPEHKGKKCLVLDLDETLVHSSFKPITAPDFIIPVEIDNVVYRVYVMKRPFVDEFLKECAKNYEVVIFTASLAKYADPLLDRLDPDHTITYRLFRESCVLHGNSYVKDLRKIGRKLKDTIIVDNSPQSYLFQPRNAIPILSWFDDKTDTQLQDLLPCLNTTLKNIKDVRKILNASEKSYEWLCEQHNKPLSLYK